MSGIQTNPMPDDFPTWRVVEPEPVEILYADPAWAFKNYGGDKPGDIVDRGRGASKHYHTMGIRDMARLPIKQITAPNAVCFMWMSWPHLNAALFLLRAWGFDYRSRAFCWVKPRKSTAGRFIDDITADRWWDMTQGYGTRANDEICLLGFKGGGLPRQNKGVRSLIVQPRRGQHSEKPKVAYGRMERLYGVEHVKMELFARNLWPDWVSVGFDVNDRVDMRDVLRDYCERLNR
jgi:N6-adenosine-specific RNA methylase IME4